MTTGSLPPEYSLDDVKVRIRKTYSNPNVRTITQAVLKDGPRTFKIATLLELINFKTGEFHHHSLKIDHIEKLKAGWFAKPKRSARLDSEEPDEIEKLYRFLHAIYGNDLKGETGQLHLIRSEDYAKLEKVLEALPSLTDTDKRQLIKNLLSQVDGTRTSLSEFVKAFQGVKEETLRHLAAASRMVEYTKAFNKLKALIDDASTKEKQLQAHLEGNPWMFGSEYSELLSRRTWTRDDRLDYMLRRTVDDYLEIVEIKTAFSDPLFIYDSSHDNYYPSAKLSPVIGQVTRYIEEVERNRDTILEKDSADTLKIRARAIVGRDGSTEEQAALRNLNAHLHRIEIITFDQLLRIAKRVLTMFASDKPCQEESDKNENQ